MTSHRITDRLGRLGRRIGRRLGLAIAVLIAIAVAAHAARATSATFSVEIGTAGPSSWRADALSIALRADLADGQLQLPAPGKTAELSLRGELSGDTLHFVIYHRGAPIRGVIALDGLDRASLAGIFRDRLNRLVGNPSGPVRPGPSAAVAPPGSLGGALAALGLLAILFVAPTALAVFVLPRASWRGLRSRRGAALGASFVGAVAISLVVFGDHMSDAGGPILIVGGLAWGALAVVVLPIAAPPLFGLHRIEHGELVPVLRAWLALAITKTSVLGLIAVPVLGGLGLVGWALELPLVIMVGIVVPVAGLAIRHVRHAIVEILAVRLDAAWVDGDATASEPWHSQVQAYFVGYLRRANVTVDDELVARARFLPGKGDDIVVYGGGVTHTRIVIGRAVLEYAFAPYGRPHDYAVPRVSTLHWTHWNAGLVMPTEPGAKLATKEQRQPIATVDEGAHERIALGELPTLAGLVEPIAFDPRTSYRPGDDPMWLDWDPGEEFDGTDAGDKDFLFGAIMFAIGMIQRREDRGATLALAWHRWTSGYRAARLLERITAPVRALVARRIAALGDAHAALGGARHHLVQYLAWRLWHREDLVTPRAFVPVLERTTRKIFATLDADPEADDTSADRAWRHRLAGLRQFVTGSSQPRSQRQRLAVGFAVLAGLAALATLVVQAARYHPRYEQLMTQQHERFDDGNRP